MTKNEITQKLTEVFSMAMGPAGASISGFDRNSALVEDLGLNSVGILYVVIAIEEYFAIQFDDVGFNDFKTVGDVIDYIDSKVNQ
jgi:acyl carrier protein